MTDESGPRVSRIALLVSLVIAGSFTVLFFSYSFNGTPPFVDLNPARNPHFAAAALFAENLGYLAGSAVLDFASLSLRLVNLLYLFGAAVIAFASLSVGLFILNRIGFSKLPAAEKGPFAFALGLGVFSLATLGLGLAGLLIPQVFYALVIVVGATGAVRAGKFLWRLRSRGEPWTTAERVFAAFTVLGGVITIVYAFIPPTEFDALEYHVGAPAGYFSSGRISYIEYNVYSNFPFNSEMLYLMSMVLSGSKIFGAVLGNILNACIAAAAVIAAYALGVYVSCRTAGIFAAAALITSMGFFAVATGVYVEPLQTLYTVLAVLAVSKFVQENNRGALVAGALVTGLAMGVKYTSAVFVAVPLAAATLLARDRIAGRIRTFVLFSVIAMLVVAPWLVKNALLTGNPVYPLSYKIFGGRDWSPVQDARWAFAHTPKGGLGLEQWARHIFGLFFGRLDITLLSFVFVPFAFARRPLPQRLLFVLGFGLLYVFLWFALTHRIDRFAVPAFAVLGAVSGAGFAAIPQGWIKRLATMGAVFLLCANVLLMAVSYGQIIDVSVPLTGEYEDFLRSNKEGYEAWMKINEVVPAPSRVLLFAEAETFYLDAAYSGSTVFDRQPLEEMSRDVGGDAVGLARAVKAAGFDYVFVNWATYKRQLETYSFVQYAGYVDPPWRLRPELFDAMVTSGHLELVFSCGQQVYANVPAYALYRVK